MSYFGTLRCRRRFESPLESPLCCQLLLCSIATLQANVSNKDNNEKISLIFFIYLLYQNQRDVFIIREIIYFQLDKILQKS
jgi:hypothetical protein